MPVIISMLRGVNLGAHNRMSMEALRDVYESLKLLDVRTFIQSGNVLFKTEEREIETLVEKIQDAIERRFKFRPDVIVRTAAELRDVIARNPFARRRGIDPAKLLITFLDKDPGEKARQHIRKLNTDPEEVRIDGLLGQVRLRIGDQLLTAVITADALQELKLRRGDDALAMIKSTEVMIGREDEVAAAPRKRRRRRT